MKRIIRCGVAVGMGLALTNCGLEQGESSVSAAPGTQTQALTNVVVNGSFEQQAIGLSNYVNLSAGSTQLTGWNVLAGIKVMHSRYKATANGTQCIDLNGSGAGAISQTLPTVPGSGYTVKFAISNSPNCATSWRYGTLTFGTQSVSLSNASGSWQYRSYVFNATDSSTVIKLESTSTGVACGLAIDDLTVTGP